MSNQSYLKVTSPSKLLLASLRGLNWPVHKPPLHPPAPHVSQTNQMVPKPYQKVQKEE